MTYVMKKERKNKIPPEHKQRGIYLIVNHGNNKVYVGSTHISFYQRWRNHIDHLRKNKHGNPYLQHAWNKYGEPMFEFMILEPIEDEVRILEAEQFYLDIFFGPNAYNINPAASSVYGRRTNAATRQYLYVYDPDGNIHGPIVNIAHFAKEKIGSSTVGLNHLLNGMQNNLHGWTRAFELTAREYALIERKKQWKKDKIVRLKEAGKLRQTAGRPATPQYKKDEVIDYAKTNPKASLRKIQQKTGIHFLTVRRILLDAGFDLVQSGVKDTASPYFETRRKTKH